MTEVKVIKYWFSDLMDMIAEARTPPYVAEHVFYNMTRISDVISAGEAYSFKTPTGDTIEVRLDV